MMLQDLREKTKSWTAYVIIGFLILSFALWGVSSCLGGGSANQSVATVNGTKISNQQFQQAVQQNQRLQQMHLGAEYSPSPELQQVLKQQTLQYLISQVALKQYIQRQHFRISTDAAEQAIYHLPPFSEEGRFSPEKYKRYLAASRLTDAQFIRQFQASMAISSLSSGLLTTSFALPGEVESVVALIQQQRDIQYAIVTLNDQAQPRVTDAQLKEYYQSHKHDYRLPETVEVEYIVLSPDTLSASINVPTDRQLKDYYRNNISQFSVHAKSENGKQEETVIPYADIKTKVANAYRQDQLNQRYQAALDVLINKSYEYPDTLQPAADAIGLKVTTSPSISSAGGEGVLANKALLSAIFSDDVLIGGNNSDVVQIDSNTAAVVRVAAHHDASYQPFDDVKAVILEKLRQGIIEKETTARADVIIGEFERGESVEKIEQQYGVAFVNSGYVGRFSKALDASLLTDAFMKNQVIDGKKAYRVKSSKAEIMVYRILGVRAGVADKDTPETLSNFRQQIVEENAQIEYALLMKGIIDQSSIKITSH